MARFSFNGNTMRQYINKLATMGEKAEEIENKALYRATKVYADELRKQTEALPVQDGMAKKGEHINVLSAVQKNELLKSISIYDVKSKRSGIKVRSVGFVGYNSIKTKKYPKGQPNRLIAASVNSGSSVRQKDPFVRRAQQGTRAKCVQEMQDTVDAEIEKYTK